MVLPDIKQIMKTGLSVRTISPIRMLTYRRHIYIFFIECVFSFIFEVVGPVSGQ